MTGRLQVGIQTYNYPPGELLGLARAADRLGFEGLWIGEHYVNPASFGSAHPGVHEDAEVKESEVLGPTIRLHDPWFALGAVAGVTKRLNTGTAITIAPLVPPLLLARASCTAYDVSGGRFRLGVGAGWLKEEFAALGVPFEERGSRLDETIDILRTAWAGGYFSHHGKHFAFPEPLQISPAATPIQLVCGGNSGPALRRVAQKADAWMNSAMISLEEALRLRDTIDTARAAAGNNRPFTYFVRPTAADPALIERFAAAGFENIVLWAPHIWPRSEAEHGNLKTRHLASFARELGLTVKEAGNENE